MQADQELLVFSVDVSSEWRPRSIPHTPPHPARAPTSHRAHVLGELRFEVAARRAVLAAELGSDFASADLRLTLLQRSSGRRFGLGLGLGEG